jgi:hypothetical protein
MGAEVRFAPPHPEGLADGSPFKNGKDLFHVRRKKHILPVTMDNTRGFGRLPHRFGFFRRAPQGFSQMMCFPA